MDPTAQLSTLPAVGPGPTLMADRSSGSSGQEYLQQSQVVVRLLQSSAWASRSCHQKVAQLHRDMTLQRDKLEAIVLARRYKANTLEILQLLQSLQAIVQQTLQDTSSHGHDIPDAAWKVLRNYADQAEVFRSQLDSRTDLVDQDTLIPLSRRSHMLQREQTALSHQATCPCKARLCAVVKLLRALETSYTFQSSLAMASCTQADASRRTHETFAYGSTPFHSWQAIMAQVSKEVEQTRHADLELMVWGSSVGWLVFYSALSLGLTSSGYEILEPLHNAAIKLQQQLQASRPPPSAQQS
ncbi:hypothetical protein WJX74_007625 [Apatococcus lobatus]|uniref:Uncharacterized protein n=1 Tax=Apatococcus lobatus TaxID=904363 RepID=A0AAW1QHX4_9CHLO